MTPKRFKPGDQITVARNAHPDQEHDYFNRYIGKTGKIVAYNCMNDLGQRCWFTDIEPDPADGIVNRVYGLSVCEEDIEHTSEGK